MMSNYRGMTRHSWYAGMVAVCISDHLWKDKVNYLSRYDVLSVGPHAEPLMLDAHFSGLCLSIRDRNNLHVVQVPAEMFVPAHIFDGDVMRNDEKAMADQQPVVKRTDLQAQQFENVPDTFSIADREILGKLEAMGKAPNPKAGMGDKKPSLTLCPLSASIAQEAAQRDGMLKYGWVNWREVRIQPQTYIDAAMRHLRLYENGEEYARDTGVSNLGAVMACCAIIIDSAAHGTLDDNRKHSPQSCDMLHEAEVMVKKLGDMQKDREAKKNG